MQKWEEGASSPAAAALARSLGAGARGLGLAGGWLELAGVCPPRHASEPLPCLPTTLQPTIILPLHPPKPSPPKKTPPPPQPPGYYITGIAGSDASNSLVVMSKGTKFTQQSYKAREGERVFLGGRVCGFLGAGSIFCYTSFLQAPPPPSPNNPKPTTRPNPKTSPNPNSPSPPKTNPQQVAEHFPYEWIKKKWRDGFHVTAMATAREQWAVVMSRNAGFADQARRGGGGRWGGV